MKKGEVYIGTVQKTEFPNRGRVLVFDEQGEEVAFVKNVIPGQKIRFRVNKKKGGRTFGQCLEVLEKASDEFDEPNCPHFGICGGCLYQTISYDRQLDIKESQMKELLIPVIGEDVFSNAYEGIAGSPKEEGYRNKMEFSFGDEIKDGPLTLGMHKRGSFYDVVNVDGCRLIAEDIRKVLKVTHDYFSEKEISYYHKMSHEGYLRHLLIRRADNTGQMIVCLVTSTDVAAFEERISETSLISGWVEEIMGIDFAGQLCGLLHTHNDRAADIVEDQGTTVLYGRDYIVEQLLGLDFKITPFSFFQNNSKGAEILYSTAKEYLGEMSDAPVLYDLYSGTGTIAQVLSPAVKEVYGVEIVKEAVCAAIDNAKLNEINNCHFIAGDVLAVLDDIETLPDTIVLDPPRDGINPKALNKIIDYGVDNILYISCGPKSLARDLEVLIESYEVKKIRFVDLFPGTYHCEVICQLSKQNRKPDAHIDFELTAEEYEELAGDEHRKLMDEWKKENNIR